MKLRLFGALVLGGLIAASAASSAASAPAAHEITVAIGGESADGYDPTLGWGRYGSPLFQSTLLKRDQNLQIVNDLADTVSTSPDAQTWTVTIRKDVVFSDGQPLTARDVAYTFAKAAEAGGKTDVTNLQGAKATDDYTVQFTLKKPQSTFVNRLATLGIVPEHAHGPNYARNPIGSGPYKLVRWDQGQQLIVEANPRYYGPQPQITRVTFIFSEDDVTNLTAAQAGKVQVASVAQSFAVQQIPDMKLVRVKSVDNRGLLFPTQPADGRTTTKGYPIGNNVTNDLAIRQAVNDAIDRNALVGGVLEGFGSPAFGPANGLPWDQPSEAIQDANPDAARQVLTDAGWAPGPDGVMQKDGVRAEFQIIFPAGDTVRQELALSSADMLKPIGINATPVGKSWDDIGTLMSSNVVVFGWGSHDPTEIYNIYHSSFAGIDFYNPGFYQSPRTDAELDKAMGAPNEEEAIAFWKNAQWNDSDGTGVTAKGDAVWAWLVNLDHTYFVSNCLDVGSPQVEPHGHGWPITANLASWRSTCS